MSLPTKSICGLCDFAGEPSLWRRGWHHGTNAQFSSAALAARLAGDDPLRTAHAMAIAASHQNTLAQLQSGAVSMIKGTAEGWVAKAGVEAALLAHHGVTGPLALMEGAAGWAACVAGAVDFDALCAPLNGRYRLLETSIKPYPAVATAVAPIRAAIELHRAGLPPLGEIERIVVRLPAFALGTPSAHAGWRYPEHIESAQHSFYDCPVIALLDGAWARPNSLRRSSREGSCGNCWPRSSLTRTPSSPRCGRRVPAARSSSTCATAACAVIAAPIRQDIRVLHSRSRSWRPSFTTTPIRC